MCSGMKCDWPEMLSARDLSSPTEGQSLDDDASEKGTRVPCFVLLPQYADYLCCTSSFSVILALANTLAAWFSVCMVLCLEAFW
jgi:hypothetical protein